MTTPTPEVPHSGLVSVDELIRHMSGVSVNMNQRIAFAETLAGTQQELESYLNRPLEPVQMREFVRVDPAGFANVSLSPIHKVIRVEPVDTPFSYTGFNFAVTPYAPPVIERDPIIGENGQLIDRFTPSFGDPVIVAGGIYIGQTGGWYAIEYIGGYNGHLVQGLKTAIKTVAARSAGRLHDDTISLRESGAQKAAEVDERPVGWTEEELKKWDRLRRRVIV